MSSKLSSLPSARPPETTVDGSLQIRPDPICRTAFRCSACDAGNSADSAAVSIGAELPVADSLVGCRPNGGHYREVFRGFYGDDNDIASINGPPEIVASKYVHDVADLIDAE